MKLTAVAPILSSIYSNISNHSVGKTLASFLNDALSKYAGVKKPPFNPISATLLVGGLTLAAVGTLFYAVFGSSKKPPAPPQQQPKPENTPATTTLEKKPETEEKVPSHDKEEPKPTEEELSLSPKAESPKSEVQPNPVEENTPASPKSPILDPFSTPVDEFIQGFNVSGEVVQRIIDSDELLDDLIARTRKNRFMSQKKVKAETGKVSFISFALKDSCPLERFKKLADAVTQIPLSEFNFLLGNASSNELVRNKLEYILSSKKVSYIAGSSPFDLLLSIPVEHIQNFPNFFKSDVNTKNDDGETLLTHLAKEVASTNSEEHLSRIQALLACGAKPTIKNKSGKNAVDLAPATGEIRTVLEKAAGKPLEVKTEQPAQTPLNEKKKSKKQKDGDGDGDECIAQ